MIDFPKTVTEANQYRYGTWAGNPNGNVYRPLHCAYEVWRDSFISHQCSRSNGYGPSNLYCKQHAKIVEGK